MPGKITGSSRNTTSSPSDAATVAKPAPKGGKSKTSATTPAAVTARAADVVATPVTAQTPSAQASSDALTQAAQLATAALQQKSDPFSASTAVTAGSVTASGSLSGDVNLAALQLSSATATAAMKALLGGTTLNAKGTLAVTNNKLTNAQLTAAVQTLFGSKAQLSSDGTFSIDKGGVSAQLASEFKAVYGALSLDTSGSLSVAKGAVSGTLQAQVKDVLGANTLITNNQVQFDGTGFASAALNDQLVSQLGPDASLDTQVQASVDRDGIASATATAAFKALLGQTTLDTTGTGLTVTNNTLSAAQFKAAVATVFGPNATLSNNGTFTWDKASGVSADLVSAFKLATQSLSLDVNGTLSVKAGKASGQLTQSLNAVLGKQTIVASNQVVFKDNAFVSSTLNDSLVSQFGPAASLSTVFQASIDSSGVASATATAAFKALLGKTSIDTAGTGVTITNNTLSAAQFQAAVQTVFGPDATLSNNGTFVWDKASGISGALVSSFKLATQALTLDANGTLSLKGGQVSGSLQENLNAVLGKATVVANNQVVFQDNAFASAALNDQLVTKFGTAGSLDTTFQASIDQSGIASATATAAFKALLGKTTIDTTGSGLTLTKNKLTAAQFQAAVSTVFGPNAALSSKGSFTWDPQSGVSADVVSAFKLATKSLTLSADGTLSVAGGKVSGQLAQSLNAVLGPATVVANNQVVFKDNAFVSATLDDQLVAKFGPSSSLASTFQASIDSSGIAAATATAAFKALLGNTSIDTTGTSLTIKNNALTAAQFQAAVSTVFGPKATLDADGSFKWDPATGVSGDLVSSFKLATQALTLNVDGTLSVTGGRVSGSLQENLNAVLGNATVVANNQIVFKDNAFQTATLNDEVVSKFGTDASLDTVFKASVDQNGLASATATAAFKALVGNTLIDTSGTGLTIKNSQLTDAQFKAAIATTFGPNAKLTASGTFAWSNTTGVSADTVAAFKGTYGGLSIDANGSLGINGGKLSGTLAANIATTLGANAIVANNQIVFKDNGFQSATLDDELVSKFGNEGSLDTTFKASIDQSGIATATATAAYKALIGNTTIDTSGTGITIKNNKLTDAQFAAAVATTFGPNAKLTGTGTFTWDAASGVSADVAAAFSATVKNVTLDATGNLALNGGKLNGSLAESIKTTLGDNTFIANNQVVFKDSRFYSASLEDSLTKQFGANGSLTANVAATVKQNGLIDGTISVAAFTRLKELSNGGAVNIQADGTVTIKDNHIDRAEVSALLTLVAGKDVNVSASGKLIYADGKVDPQFAANLQAAWGTTSVAANGTLTFVGGTPQVTGQVSALFGGANLKGGASIAVTGADSAQLSLKLNELGTDTNISQTGSLIIDKGHITGGGLTTNLVTQGKSPADVSLSGLISLSDDQAAANFKTQVNLGVFKAGLGVSASSTVSVYTATDSDPGRLAVQNAGGVWAQRDATFDLTANAGAGITVLVGAVPLTLGFSADAEKQREVHILSIHASQEDALAQSPVTVIHPPTTVDQVLAMRPYEQYSDSGTQSIGMGGNASIGIGAGPAAVKAGGSVYFQITGDLSRDIERLDNNKVRVRIKRGSGSTRVKALTASVGLDAGKIAANNALVQKAAPLIQQLAQVGVSAKWQTINQDEPVFDVTIDLTSPFGKSAMEHILTGELTEAQYYAGYRDSGVQLNSEVDNDIKATTRTLDLNLGVLDAESLSRWLDAKQTSVSPTDFTFTEAVDDLATKKALFPWNPDSRSDVRFVHETRVANTQKLPDLEKLKKRASLRTMVAHIADDDDKTPPATLADAAAMFGLRFRLAVPKTGQLAAQRNLDAALTMMGKLGFNTDELGAVGHARAAVSSPLAPPRDAVFLGIGDQRFGQTAVDVEGFLGPQGFSQVFANRTPNEFRNAYIEAASVTGSAVTLDGTRAAIERTLGARLMLNANGAWDVLKGSQRLGTLTAADLETVRDGVVTLATATADPIVQQIKLDVGTWVGSAPKTLISLDSDDWSDASHLLSQAADFTDTMVTAAKLWAENQQPTQSAGEKNGAYAERVAEWKTSSLFNKPEVFFEQMDELFRQAIQNDKTPTTALALMGLAGPSHIYGKAHVELPDDTLKAMVAKGRTNVQTFAAVDVLAGLGASLDKAGNLQLKSQANAAAATAAAQQLFGANAAYAANAAGATISGLTFSNPDFRDALTRFFSAVTVDGGAMKLGALDAATQTALLGRVFGGTATVSNGDVVFDNTGYSLIHFADALNPFKGALGVQQFPSLVPISDTGPAQAYDSSGLVARHNGLDSHWGDAFSHLEYLSGQNEDLGNLLTKPNSWILHGAGG